MVTSVKLQLLEWSILTLWQWRENNTLAPSSLDPVRYLRGRDIDGLLSFIATSRAFLIKENTLVQLFQSITSRLNDCWACHPRPDSSEHNLIDQRETARGRKWRICLICNLTFSLTQFSNSISSYLLFPECTTLFLKNPLYL